MIAYCRSLQSDHPGRFMKTAKWLFVASALSSTAFAQQATVTERTLSLDAAWQAAAGALESCQERIQRHGDGAEQSRTHEGGGARRWRQSAHGRELAAQGLHRAHHAHGFGRDGQAHRRES